jgi:hypothetical protein
VIRNLLALAMMGAAVGCWLTRHDHDAFGFLALCVSLIGGRVFGE